MPRGVALTLFFLCAGTLAFAIGAGLLSISH